MPIYVATAKMAAVGQTFLQVTNMHLTKRILMSSLVGLTACTPFVLAPGAEQVKLTTTAADVADCTPVGNIRTPKDEGGVIDTNRAVGQMKNQAVGLNGNVAFVTEGGLVMPTAAVAYRCSPKS